MDNNNNIESSRFEAIASNNNNTKTKVKLPPLRGNKTEVKSSDALRRAKAKYYQKMKQNNAYMQDMRNRAQKYYHEHKKLAEIEKQFPNISE